MAEQVIGPYSRPYHKTCLTCTVCNKRLDSTLLVEHEGEPYCKNCHKAHLGQGKGGFGLSVPLRPEKPAALRSDSLSYSPGLARRSTASSDHTSEASRRVEERLNEEMSGISISRRQDNPSPTLRSAQTHEPHGNRMMNTSKPTTVAQSIDDLVSSGVDVPIPYRRTTNGVAGTPINDALYGDQYGSTYSASSSPRRAEHAAPQEAARYGQADVMGTAAPSEQFSGLNERSDALAAAPSSMAPRSGSPLSKPLAASSYAARSSNIGTIPYSADGLPSPQRKDPIALARERERGLNFDSAGTAKTYSPRTTPVSPTTAAPYNGTDNFDADRYGYSPNSALTKMGLGSTVSAAAVGTPLCARCERPVYFAEQKQAAGRKWHRGCLRCDGCSTTLESGKLEEGPLSATYGNPTNIWCRTCYAKRFGPKGIGVAGMSLPEMMK
jgi:hypothetical protein